MNSSSKMAAMLFRRTIRQRCNRSCKISKPPTRARHKLGNVLGLNGPAGNQSALAALKSTPGYQFQLQQGNNAINAAAAAGGTLNSGNQQLALANYN